MFMEPPSVYWNSIGLLNLKARKNWNTIDWIEPLPYNIYQSKCPKLKYAGHVYGQIKTIQIS